MINKLYFIIVFFFVSCSEIDENEVESSAEDLIDWTSIDLTNDFVIGNFDEKGINKTKLQAELDNISDFFRSDLYSLGVFSSMMLIVGVLLILKSLGEELAWGFQLQNEYFVYFMIALLMLVGLNLLGVFSFGDSISSKAAN